MDLALTEVQVMLQNAAREFMESELPKSRVLEIDESESGFSSELWERICELGWPGMVIPEQYGGSGNTLTDLGAIYEVLGYYACPSPHLSSAVLCARAILEAGDQAQKQALLPDIASGRQICAFAYTEPEYGWSPISVQLTATPRDGGFALNGAKLFVPDADVADRLLVVDRSAPGVSVRVQSGWIGPKVCEVNFADVVVPASNVLGTVGGAWPAIEKAMDDATALLSIYMAGRTQKVYELARDYSQTRIAFGVPIGTFQRVQDYVIEALTEADAAKWSTYEALWQLDEGMEEAPTAVSMAKAVVSHGFPQACDASHHVHGGIGTDLEYGLTQYTKRARTLQHYLGDAIYHKRRMAQRLT